jgi:hypothetical protein
MSDNYLLDKILDLKKQLDEYRKQEILNNFIGTWNPTFINLTIVGSPNCTARYIKIGRMTWVYIQIQAATSTASVAASTYCSNLPFTAGYYAGCNVVNASTVLPVGVAVVGAGTTNLWLPAWGASANYFIASGWYEATT